MVEKEQTSKKNPSNNQTSQWVTKASRKMGGGRSNKCETAPNPEIIKPIGILKRPAEEINDDTRQALRNVGLISDSHKSLGHSMLSKDGHEADIDHDLDLNHGNPPQEHDKSIPHRNVTSPSHSHVQDTETTRRTQSSMEEVNSENRPKNGTNIETDGKPIEVATTNQFAALATFDEEDPTGAQKEMTQSAPRTLMPIQRAPHRKNKTQHNMLILIVR